MNPFNLTEWALKHKQFIYFFVVLFFIAGIFSYKNMGRAEDPDFVIKQMVIAVPWPGATARQMEEQVTDKVEKKLQDLPGLDYLKSYSTPGLTVIYVNLKDNVPKTEIRSRWVEARNMVNDVKSTFPTGVMDPIFNDRFDEVYGIVYALTGDGYSYEQMREKAENIRRIFLGVSNVRKVKLLGVQTEKIYVEIENSKLAQLGIPPEAILSTLQAQNAMAPSGMLQTSSDDVYLRVTGMFENLEDIQNLPIGVNGSNFRLGDIAKVTRGYSDPSDPQFYYNGQPAIGIAVAMDTGGNILDVGKDMEKTTEHIQKELPAGLELHQTVNQPKVVEESIDDFVESLVEAVVIVLIVSFISLGARSGMIVALCIPLVIAAVFTVMKITGIDLHRTSLGALIIALGLLVDDAIITIETMVVKLEEGWERVNAAKFAYASTAYPRLTGELVTCAGFIPVGFSNGNASEYCVTMFYVIAMSLLISWLVAGTATPLFGYLFIKVKPHTGESNHDVYGTPFYQKFRGMLSWCLSHRTIMLGGTVTAFVLGVLLLGQITQQFFPSSTRPELIVQLRLQEGASLENTEKAAKEFAQRISDDPGIAYYTYHVGEGAPRFVLTIEPELPKSNFAEFIIVAKDDKVRDQLRAKYAKILNDDFPTVRYHTKVISIGPAADYPVMLRVKGYDVDKVREISEQVKTTMAANPNVRNVNMKWNEKSKIAHLTIDQDKARKLGVSSATLAMALQTQLSGLPISQFREEDRTVDMVFRLDPKNRNNPQLLKDINIHTPSGRYVPLDQIAKISYDAENGLIYRRDLKPMILVQAELKSESVTGQDVTTQVYEQLKPLRENLPFGYSIEYDGSNEDSAKALNFLLQPVPAMCVIIMVILMTQLQSIPKMILTLLTAPLGIIGVSVGLFISGKPLGFVVQLGILALSGIIMRNSVILIDQIDQQIAAGLSPWNAVIEATVIRLRPILLTAAAAILGMVPLLSSVFWGPLAVTIAAGLLGATALTLLVLPVMYAAWYKINRLEANDSDLQAASAPVTKET
ncbi:multidrug efflux pump subunit AcrB [Sporomusaceae bacterium BoRhaA]|uniref:efflux RND transporter permease subunit n=1 Tax=Pelorhabdus rhamnosifermentans TaxID=2772457 RepID=UPI001C05F2A0|nr:efflux RND transporter permease subunit [Pelorhabdus rhamnosifermentans]MBU2699466.1 multidrug efflux pump subunit AcrB [Pelorhabdus rhamnosifermentans]